ncbi:unnamed protein product [Dicrocoelium dendriticum]|nr:unnamed protein product [Dicrocoelium dendriticum]
MDVFGKITVALHYASLASTSKKADQYLSKLHPIPKRLPVHIITQHWPSEFNILPRGASDLHGFIELSALESVPSSVVGTASSIATVSLQEKCASGGSSVQPVPGTVKTAAESSDWRKTKKRLKMPDALIEESSPTSDDLYSLQNGNVSTPSTESSTSSSEAGQRGKACSPGCIKWVNALKTNYPNIKNVQEMDYALRRMFSRSMEHLNYVEKMRYAIRQKHSIIRYQQKLQQ